MAMQLCTSVVSGVKLPTPWTACLRLACHSEEYRACIDRVWSDVLSEKQRAYIASFMTRLGYRQAL